MEVKELLCWEQDWRFLPKNIGYVFPNLRKLAARGLNIKLIERSNFKNMENLEILNIKQNLIEQLPPDCFEDLRKLVEINISENRLNAIHAIHAKTFIHNPSLKLIDLSWNEIQPTELKNLRNTNVQFLDMYGTHIKSIPFDAFDGLPNLKVIEFSESDLTTFHRDTFLNNPKLTKLFSHHSQIQILPEGLFRNNRNLNYLGLWGNNITEVKLTIQTHGEFNFQGNICIDKVFASHNAETLKEMNEELQRLC